MESLEQSLQKAVQHHQAGRLSEAEALYRQVLQLEPNQPVALNLLGVVALQVGNAEAAIELMSKSVHIQPDYADAHNNLGQAFQTSGKVEDARASFEKAVTLKPDYAEAHANLGNALQAQGFFDQAAQSYLKALEINPGYLKAHSNLGLAYKELERLEEAEASFRTALSLNPEFPEALNNLGNLLKDRGDLQEAEGLFTKALGVDPQYAEAHNNLGLVLHSQGRMPEALEKFQKAVDLNPTYVEALNNLGNGLHTVGQVNEAVACYNRTLEIEPENAETFNYLGNACKELGKMEDSISAYQEALRLRPDFDSPTVNLLHQLRHAGLWPEVEVLQGRVDELTERRLCDGKSIAMRPFDHVTSCDDAKENLKIAKANSADIVRKMSGIHTDFDFSGRSPVNPKITIGYLSCDFQNHATAHLMLSLFRQHDRDNFNIFTFSHGRNDGSVYRKKIVEDSDKFFDLEQSSHLEAARTIYGSGVDILIDLKGHTGNNRLEICALKPAPVQVSYLGFPGTSGADFLDYFIGDPIVTPPGACRILQRETGEPAGLLSDKRF